MSAVVSFDVAIVGAGPAGIAAACAASESGKRVVLFDESPSVGGQIWRGGVALDPLSRQWLARFQASRAEIRNSARVVLADAPSRQLTIETDDTSYRVRFESLILATGARERFLPFPGWTLPNVMGAGGLQAFVKGGLSVKDKRIVVAGSGPLLLAVAAFLKAHGAIVSLVAEQASPTALAKFSLRLLGRPAKARQAFKLKTTLLGIPYRTGCYITEARGSNRVEQAEVQSSPRRWAEPCDFLAVGYGLVANAELATSLGCKLNAGTVEVDQKQQTSIENVFCAGEATGIGGVDLSLLEGEIAGYSASGRARSAAALFNRRRHEQLFARAIDEAFALGPQLKTLPNPDTVVCRCEDVSYSALHRFQDWRSAKLQTRCGMGTCQGRVCGAATDFLFGWHTESGRPPVLPARIETLIRR